MSSDEKRLSTESAPRSSPAAGVSFGHVGGGDRHGESSSQGGSRGSTERWSEKRDSWKERLLASDWPGRRNEDNNGGSEDGIHKRARRSGGGGGFLMENVFTNGTSLRDESSEQSNGKRRAVDTSLHVEKRRHAGARPSTDSHRSSPLSREISQSQPLQIDAQEQRPGSRSTTMDPAQLVQMALNLSESRKRQASNTIPLPLTTPRNRHVSGPGERLGSVMPRGSGRQRVSMPSYDSSPRPSTHNEERRSEEAQEDLADNIVYTFTPATLARAEKARKYFELANEHRRLLQYLPPLRPDADSSGNYMFESRSSPGYTQPEIRRVRSHTASKPELGRQYNPLQALRNRRLRNRERRPFPVPPDQFQDPEEVISWLDTVQRATHHPEYRAPHDVVRIPRFGKEQYEQEGLTGATNKGHRRTGTAASIITRPENGWSVDPAELLADAYWTEQGDSKALIENRRNQRLFPDRKHEATRASAELDRKGMNVDGTLEGEAPGHHASSKHHHHLSLHNPIVIGRNKLHRLGRSTSVSTASSVEEWKPNPLNIDVDRENTGPLQRHMDKVLAKDQNAHLVSPELVSPDHWDSKHTPFPTHKTRSKGKKHGSVEYTNGSLSGGSLHDHQRSKSADGRVGQLLDGERARSSFDSTPPMSPIAERFVPSMGIDLSPPFNVRHTTAHKQHKSHILPIFRSKSKERNTTEGRDFAVTPEEDRSRETSGTAIDPTRLSVESIRPAVIRRHRTTDSVASSLHRSQTQRTQGASEGSIKEPGSAVGRFFRSRKIGNLMRSENSRFAERRRMKSGDGFTSDASAAQSDGSDTEGSVVEPAGGRSTNDSDASPRASFDSTRGKMRSHIPNLPTFTSTATKGKPTLLTPVISREEEEDPINRQAAAQRKAGRSERIQRLLPPRINLPGGVDEASNDLPSQKSDSYLAESRRKSYGFLENNGQQDSARSSRVSLGEPGKVGYKDHMPVSGLAKIKSEDKRRHWSISDRGLLEQQRQATRQHERVTARDLARAQALLLASGIKAQSLKYRANNPATPAPKFLVKAAMTSSRDTPSVPLRESHVTAANILCNHLDKTLDVLGNVPNKYHSTIGPRLHSRLDDLKALANDKLTAIVHNSTDEADAFSIQLASEQTLRVKQVDDAVDEMLRLRRRQLRILKKTGFKILEWMVLGLMWGVWFAVVCYNTVRRILVGILKLLGWLFSL